jgi:hypothetical protein
MNIHKFIKDSAAFGKDLIRELVKGDLSISESVELGNQIDCFLFGDVDAKAV